MKIIIIPINNEKYDNQGASRMYYGTQMKTCCYILQSVDSSCFALSESVKKSLIPLELSEKYKLQQKKEQHKNSTKSIGSIWF